jgi:hypothetical protein
LREQAFGNVPCRAKNAVDALANAASARSGLDVNVGGTGRNGGIENLVDRPDRRRVVEGVKRKPAFEFSRNSKL